MRCSKAKDYIGGSTEIYPKDLWNASYESLLRLDMPEKSSLLGYTDYVPALFAGRIIEYVQSKPTILK